MTLPPGGSICWGGGGSIDKRSISMVGGHVPSSTNISCSISNARQAKLFLLSGLFWSLKQNYYQLDHILGPLCLHHGQDHLPAPVITVLAIADDDRACQCTYPVIAEVCDGVQ